MWTPRRIEFDRTTPYTLEQDGFSKRLNRTFRETMSSMPHDSKLPALLGEAATTAAYVRNRLPHGDDYEVKTLYEIYTGHKPSFGHLRPLID